MIQDSAAIHVVKDLPSMLTNQDDRNSSTTEIDSMYTFQQSIESFYQSMEFVNTSRAGFSAAFKGFSFLKQENSGNYNTLSDFLFLSGNSSEGTNLMVDFLCKWKLNSPELSMILIVKLRKLNSPKDDSNQYFLKWIAQHLRRRLETVSGSEYPTLDETQIAQRENIDALLLSWGI